MSGEADTGLFGAMHILSSEVATDPVLGLFGYVCDVTKDGENYNVKLYIKLNSDKYSNAVVSKNSNSVKLKMKNVEGTADNTAIFYVYGVESGKIDNCNFKLSGIIYQKKVR